MIKNIWRNIYEMAGTTAFPLNYWFTGMVIQNFRMKTRSIIVYEWCQRISYYTFAPSLSPTVSPSAAPTYYPFMATAKWSDTYLSIFVDIMIEGTLIELYGRSLSNNCFDIFDDDTLNVIGGNEAVCTWNIDENDNNDINIELPSTTYRCR